MTRLDHFQALILLKAAQHAIAERRKTERMCDYPPEYGGDEGVLKGIDKFLANTHVEHDLVEAMDFYQKLMKKEKT